MRVSSTMIPLGTEAPNFKLIDTISGQWLSLANIKSDVATVIVFICNHCPYVIHIQSELVRLANEYSHKKVAFIAINANDVSQYPDDAPDKMKERALDLDFCFPYLYDETQDVARAYDAACTPDFYVFDGQLKCVYRGQFDASRPGNQLPVTGNSLRQALDAILTKSPISSEQTPSVGCNIKWKAESL